MNELDSVMLIIHVLHTQGVCWVSLWKRWLTAWQPSSSSAQMIVSVFRGSSTTSSSQLLTSSVQTNPVQANPVQTPKWCCMSSSPTGWSSRSWRWLLVSACRKSVIAGPTGRDRWRCTSPGSRWPAWWWPCLKRRPSEMRSWHSCIGGPRYTWPRLWPMT